MIPTRDGHTIHVYQRFGILVFCINELKIFNLWFLGVVEGAGIQGAGATGT